MFDAVFDNISSLFFSCDLGTICSATGAAKFCIRPAKIQVLGGFLAVIALAAEGIVTPFPRLFRKRFTIDLGY